MSVNQNFHDAIERVRRGERTRVLFDLLMIELGFGLNQPTGVKLQSKDFWDALQRVLKDEQEALTVVMPSLESETDTPKESGVSVSN